MGRLSMKIATCCPPSSTSFLAPLEDLWRHAGHEVRRFDHEHENQADAYGDVVFAEWARAHARWLSVYGEKPVVIRMHRYEAWEDDILETRWDRVNCLVATCAANLGAAAARARGILDARPIVVPEAIDVSAVPFRPRTPGLKIGMVGAKDARKGVATVIRALASLPPNATLDVAGACEDPCLDEYHRHLADRLGLEDRVRFHGHVEDVHRWWNDRDICVVAAHSETGPVSAIEAMALGILPLIHDHVGARDRWPESLLWRTEAELVHKLTHPPKMDSHALRSHAKDRFNLRIHGGTILAALEKAHREGRRTP